MEVPWEQLNKQQRAVCEHLEGPVLVIGGPGSGKTTVIRHRYEQLVKNGVDPDNILLTTFSRAAAAELRERITTDTGGGTNIGTIHSIFYKIVRQHYDKLGYHTANLNLYQSGEIRELLREIVTELTHGKGSRHVINDTVQFYKANLDRVRANGMTPSDMEQAMQDGTITFQHIVSDRELDTIEDAEERSPAVYREFLDRLYNRNAIDYTGMQHKAYIVLKNNPAALQHYRDQYQYILVDEAQDLNYVQWQLIRLLGEDHRNVCMVGDDCQNIYSWRGSDHRYLHDFREIFEAAVYMLPKNYRSTQQVVDAVNRFMPYLNDVEQKTLVSDQGRTPQSDGFPRIDHYENAHLERNKIVQKIHGLVESGYDPGEIAVLLRTTGRNGEKVESYRELLSAMRLESSDTRGFRFMEKKEVQWVMNHLKAYMNPDDDIVLRNVLLSHGVPQDALDALMEEQPDDKTLRAHIADLTPLHAAIVEPDTLREMQEVIDMIVDMDDTDNLVTYVYEKTGLKQRIPDWSGDTDSRRMNVTTLREAIADFPQTRSGISDFFDYIANTATEEDTTGVTVTTMHGAKGKEWRAVFIPELRDGNVPHPVAANIEEEKRLFYVALSRAKERAYLSYHGKPSDFLEYLQQ